jgi:acetylornithine deacetylase/succinyl-diaminopimelate desuccinylase-like protein
VATGVLEGVDAIFGLHNWPTLPEGVVASRAGTIMAGTAEFRITMHGRGGHAAMPQGNIDPVPPLAALVTALQVRVAAGDAAVPASVAEKVPRPPHAMHWHARCMCVRCRRRCPMHVRALQTVVSRETAPLDSVVVSVTQLAAGDAHNVTPDAAWLGGTLRALTAEGYERAKARVAEVAHAVAAAFRCTATVDWDGRSGYPPTRNTEDAWRFAKAVAQGYATVQCAHCLLCGVVRHRVLCTLPSLREGYATARHTYLLQLLCERVSLRSAMHGATESLCIARCNRRLYTEVRLQVL